jgi:hypothetical protein
MIYEKLIALQLKNYNKIIFKLKVRHIKSLLIQKQ